MALSFIKYFLSTIEGKASLAAAECHQCSVDVFSNFRLG